MTGPVYAAPMAIGRPTRIDQVHEIDRRTGREITIGEAITRYLQQGNYLETACALVTIDKSTVLAWLRDGARIHERRLAGLSSRSLSKYQRLAQAFSLEVRKAMAEAEARDIQNLARLALGGIPQQTVTEKLVARTDAAGNFLRHPETDEILYDVAERTTRSSTTLPDAKVLEWRLERRFPDRWGRWDRVDVDISGGGLDAEVGADPVDEFLVALEAINRRKKEAMAQLEAAGALDVIDVDVLDETERPIDPGDQPL